MRLFKIFDCKYMLQFAIEIKNIKNNFPIYVIWRHTSLTRDDPSHCGGVVGKILNLEYRYFFKRPESDTIKDTGNSRFETIKFRRIPSGLA